MLNHNEQMQRLEEIPKKNIFEVPDGYFDQLALKIQSKTAEAAPVRASIGWNFALRYALPAALLVIVAIFVLKPKSVQDTDRLLASIPTEHLVAYLNESDLNEQELLEAINFDHTDADSLNLRVQEEYQFGESDVKEFESVLENEL